MKYIVEVGEPVPSNLDEIASKVAASFNISDAKAMALLRRAPGAMTKAVSEREADVVAGIFERAGLNVVKRPVDEAAGATAQSAADGPAPRGAPSREAGSAAGGMPAGAPPPVEGADDEAAEGPFGSRSEQGQAAGFGARDVTDSGGSWPGEGAEGRPAHPPRSGNDDVWSQPLGSTESEPVDRFSRRDDFEERAADIGWDAGGWSGAGQEPGSIGPADEVGGAGEDALDGELGGESGVAAGAGTTGAATTGSSSARYPGAGHPRAEEDEGIDVEVGTPPEERPASPELGEVAAEGQAADAAVGGAGVPPVGEEQEEPAPKSRRRQRQKRARAERAPKQPRQPQAAARGPGRSAARGADDTRLRSGGIRRGVGWVGVLPPLLALLAMGAAMLVTLVPEAQDQQASQAADAAASQAASLEALTGGLPLTAQTLTSALTDLSNNAQALLRPHGVSLMVITDGNGAPLAGWYGPAETPGAMPPATRQAVTASALASVSGQAPAAARSFGQSLHSTWASVKAMVGLGTEPTVLRAAPVTSAGQPIGAVVVGVPPVSGRNALVSAFEMVLLVGVIPLLIGILMAIGLTGGLRRKVQYLLHAADRISRGDLDEPVSLRSRDELGQLARAIERMRVSLSTLLEHRRRQR